jgi:hypothetical protein
MFQNVVQKWNSHTLKIDADALNRRGVAFVSAVKYIISIKDSEGSMLVRAHACTVYAVKNKIEKKQILPILFPT